MILLFGILFLSLSCIFHAALGDDVQAQVINGAPMSVLDRGGNIPINAVFPFFRCSGMFANNEWMVLAAHCVTPLSIGDSVTISYAVTDSLFSKSFSLTVAEVFIHPRYDPDRFSLFEALGGGRLFLLYGREAATDMAMVRLSTPVTTCEGSCMLEADKQNPMNSMFGYKDKSLLRQKETDLFIMGYGNTFTTKPNDDPTILRTSPQKSTVAKTGWKGAYWTNSWIDLPFGDIKGRVCPGDSGGPWAKPLANGEIAVVGITSGVVFCDWPLGAQWAFRFDSESVDFIKDAVEGSGGLCKSKSTAVESGKAEWTTLQCSNV